jgi:pyridinium-3,5-biscarboxylic acid mononucleotide sulfurtransferase
MIRLIGFAATIHPIHTPEMSFDGDSVSHYYSAVSGSLPALRALARGIPSTLLGYSGGVDSALLAVVLRQELGRERMVAAVGRSPSYPAAQWATARAVAERFDVPLVELDTHELDDPSYLANPTNRCFFCKTELWRRLVPAARARGLAVVCDGTNADDLREHRPGHAAGVAAGVRSPLAEAGFTKADVRVAARELGLPVWDAPAAPCLSSRVAYGIAITPGRLAQVERGEAYLRDLGVTGDLRLRHHGERARIEVEPRWIPWLAERLPAVARRLGELGFAAVELDPRGYRRGSLLAGRAAGA